MFLATVVLFLCCIDITCSSSNSVFSVIKHTHAYFSSLFVENNTAELVKYVHQYYTGRYLLPGS